MQTATTKGTETKAIMEFLAGSPDVDVSRACERYRRLDMRIGTRQMAETKDRWKTH